MRTSKETLVSNNLEWLKNNDHKMVGNTFCFIYDNKEIEIKRINGIWTLIQ